MKFGTYNGWYFLVGARYAHDGSRTYAIKRIAFYVRMDRVRQHLHSMALPNRVESVSSHSFAGPDRMDVKFNQQTMGARGAP